MSPTRVLLADDHMVVRVGLKTLIESIEGVEVVAEASNGHEAVALACSLRPEIIVMDVQMPQMNGIEATAQLRQALPETRVIILTMHDTDDIVEAALRAGASAYLLKDAAVAELELALQAVRRGESFLSPAVTTRMVERSLDSPRGTARVRWGRA